MVNRGVGLTTVYNLVHDPSVISDLEIEHLRELHIELDLAALMKRKEQIDQLAEMSVADLKDQADALKESLFRLKFRKALGVGETVSDIRREKRTLARVHTLISQKSKESQEAKA